MSGVVLREWKGLDQTQRELEGLQLAIQQARHEALDWYGKTATTNMKAKHERDAHLIERYVNRTWRLTNSIAYDIQAISDMLERLRVVATPFYAALVEFGTARSRPYPFFWIEMYGLEEMARQRVHNNVLKTLQNHQKAYVDGYGRSNVGRAQ
jgi:hypothetical protein